MEKEHRMLQARILKAQGYKQTEIAEMLGVTDRTVRNYLTHPPTPRKKAKRKSLLDPYKTFIESVIKEQPLYNCVLLYERLKRKGYLGKISILRDHVAKVRKRVLTEAVIRYETEAGRQAQVDWKEYRVRKPDGHRRKVYAFVMTLGYSRRFFVCFTQSMKQSVLHACHVKAFEYFGGVVEEILYDNMKTAFVCDTEGRFHPNKRLLGFAAHYGFVPKRCQIYRPQTKGKVERSIGYLSCNFWPRVRGLDLCLEELNEAVQGWLKEIDRKEIRELGESRERRFEQERKYLRALPLQPYDWREVHELIVSRESCITFEANRYSVPPRYIGQSLTLKVDRLCGEAELFCAAQSIRSYQLERKGARKRIMFAEDVGEINKLWFAQFVQRTERKANRGVDLKENGYEVQIRPPAVYEKLFAELPEEVTCRS
jgi:transposase